MLDTIDLFGPDLLTASRHLHAFYAEFFAGLNTIERRATP